MIREFDLVEKRFVDGGFYLPEAKGGADWFDADTLLVSSALGGEAFQTISGYARTVRLYRRGAEFEAAPVVFECKREDMAAWAGRDPARVIRAPNTGAKSISSITRISSSRASQDASSSTFPPMPMCPSTTIG